MKVLWSLGNSSMSTWLFWYHQPAPNHSSFSSSTSREEYHSSFPTSLTYDILPARELCGTRMPWNLGRWRSCRSKYSVQHGCVVQRSSPRLADITWTEAGGFVSVWDLVSSKEYIYNCPLPRLELSCSHSASSAPQSFTGSATLCCDQHCLYPRGQTE